MVELLQELVELLQEQAAHGHTTGSMPTQLERGDRCSSAGTSCRVQFTA